MGDVMGRMDVHYSSNKMDWETPDDLFAQWNKRFKFNLDVCAAKHNTKCKKFFSVEKNGLKKKWRGNCWMNPPYGRELKAWVQKAHRQSMTGKCCVVCLLPARTDTRMFHEYIWDRERGEPYPGVEVHFLKGRVRFKGAMASAPFPSMIVVFGEKQ
jgi:phage N-6-adenine-methyltransferase